MAVSSFPGKNELIEFAGWLEHQSAEWLKDMSLMGLNPFEQLILCCIESDNERVAAITLEAAHDVLFMMDEMPSNKNPKAQAIIEELSDKLTPIFEALAKEAA